MTKLLNFYLTDISILFNINGQNHWHNKFFLFTIFEYFVMLMGHLDISIFAQKFYFSI